MSYIKLLIFISVVPVILLCKYIYSKDRNKESPKLLKKLFVGGVLSTFLTLLLSFLLEKIFPIFAQDPENLNLFVLFINVFFGIALVEEFSKWIVTYFLSYKSKEFDEIYDMIVYSTFVALGFACLENILYVVSSGFLTGIIRALLAVPSHACDGVLMGYYLGLAKQSEINNRKDLKQKNIFLSIFIPFLVHGLYDYCLFSRNIYFLFVFLAFVIYIYILAINKIKRMSSINSKMFYENKFCPNCGLSIKTNFCGNCGRKNI